MEGNVYRKAIERIKDGVLSDKCSDGNLSWIVNLCDDALAQPKRNCDMFESETEARSAFIAYYNEAYDLKGSKYEIDTGDLKHNVDDILHDYIEWLLAPAKSETKVEGDGK